MTKYQEMVKLLDEMAKALREKAMLCYADGGNEDDRPIEDYADFQAARAIESLEAEVEKRDACIEIQDGELRRLRSKIEPLQDYSDRRVAEERRALATVFDGLAATADKHGAPHTATTYRSAAQVVRSRSNGDSPTPPVQEITPVGGGAELAHALHAISGDFPSIGMLDSGELSKLGAAISAVLSHLSKGPVAQPAGWKLMPEAPTEEMLRAAMDAVYGPAAHKNISDDGCKSIDDDNGDAYRAMYAAAPTPPVSSASVKEDLVHADGAEPANVEKVIQAE